MTRVLKVIQENEDLAALVISGVVTLLSGWDNLTFVALAALIVLIGILRRVRRIEAALEAPRDKEGEYPKFEAAMFDAIERIMGNGK